MEGGDGRMGEEGTADDEGLAIDSEALASECATAFAVFSHSSQTFAAAARPSAWKAPTKCSASSKKFPMNANCILDDGSIARMSTAMFVLSPKQNWSTS